MSNNAVPGTTMARTVGDIRKSFDQAERMNCRDILDLIEAIDFMRYRLSKIGLIILEKGSVSGDDLRILLTEALRASA